MNDPTAHPTARPTTALTPALWLGILPLVFGALVLGLLVAPLIGIEPRVVDRPLLLSFLAVCFGAFSVLVNEGGPGHLRWAAWSGLALALLAFLLPLVFLVLYLSTGGYA